MANGIVSYLITCMQCNARQGQTKNNKYNKFSMYLFLHLINCGRNCLIIGCYWCLEESIYLSWGISGRKSLLSVLEVLAGWQEESIYLSWKY